MTALPIVVVDDDIDHAVIIRTVLATLAPDASVTVITDLRGVEKRLENLDRDALLLIDRVLGPKQSHAIVEQLLVTRPDIRVVMLSSALSAEDRARALEVGAIVAAEKPGSLADWRELMAHIFQRTDRAETNDGAGGAGA